MNSRFIRLALLLVGCMALGCVAEAQTFNKKKPKTTVQVLSVDETEIPIPGRPYGKYVWRKVYTCNAKWFSDGHLKSCEGIEGTTRWRLESNGNFAEDIFWDPGSGPEPQSDILNSNVLLVLQDNAVTIVSLPSGKQTRTSFVDWHYLSAWGFGSSWYLQASTGAAKPWPLVKLNDDGTYGEPVSHSNAFADIRDDGEWAWCSASARAVVLPAEYSLDAIAGRPWAELRRLAFIDGAIVPTSLSPEGNIDEKCATYQAQFYIGKRASDGAWSVLGNQGDVVSSTTYPSFEAARAEAPRLLRAAGISAENSRIVQAERDRASAEQAARRAEEYAAEEAMRVAEARANADELFQQGRFEEAANAAYGLETTDWVVYVLAWRTAPLSVYQSALNRIAKDREEHRDWSSKSLEALERRVSGIQACEMVHTANLAPNSSKWLSTPSTQRWLDMNALKAGIDTTEYSKQGMHLAFDATAYEWVWVSYGASEIINIPSAESLYDKDTAQRLFETCESEARAAD